MAEQDEQEHIEYEIVDVKKDLATGFMLRFENKSSGTRDFKWVPIHGASPEETHAWAKAEEKRVKDKLRVLRRGQSSRNLKARLLLLEDLLEGEVVEPVKPEWASKSSSPAGSSPDIPPHAPFYPTPTPTRGYCDNAEHPSATLNHSTLVAACQSDKHLSNTTNSHATRHLVCTNCHDDPPVHRLTQHEQDHMVRDKGLFPLCLSCAEWWCNRYGLTSEEDGNNCTCKERLPQWLCADCWVESAKARSRRRDDCEECGCAKGKEEEDRDEISQAVRWCSGCQGLVIEHGDDDDHDGDYDDDDDEDRMSISTGESPEGL